MIINKLYKMANRLDKKGYCDIADSLEKLAAVYTGFKDLGNDVITGGSWQQNMQTGQYWYLNPQTQQWQSYNQLPGVQNNPPPSGGAQNNPSSSGGAPNNPPPLTGAPPGEAAAAFGAGAGAASGAAALYAKNLESNLMKTYQQAMQKKDYATARSALSKIQNNKLLNNPINRATSSYNYKDINRAKFGAEAERIKRNYQGFIDRAEQVRGNNNFTETNANLLRKDAEGFLDKAQQYAKKQGVPGGYTGMEASEQAGTSLGKAGGNIKPSWLGKQQQAIGQRVTQTGQKAWQGMQETKAGQMAQQVAGKAGQMAQQVAGKAGQMAGKAGEAIAGAGRAGEMAASGAGRVGEVVGSIIGKTAPIAGKVGQIAGKAAAPLAVAYGVYEGGKRWNEANQAQQQAAQNNWKTSPAMQMMQQRLNAMTPEQRQAYMVKNPGLFQENDNSGAFTGGYWQAQKDYWKDPKNRQDYGKFVGDISGYNSAKDAVNWAGNKLTGK